MARHTLIAARTTTPTHTDIAATAQPQIDITTPAATATHTT
jgi:hypothetical protein